MTRTLATIALTLLVLAVILAALALYASLTGYHFTFSLFEDGSLVWSRHDVVLKTCLPFGACQ